MTKWDTMSSRDIFTLGGNRQPSGGDPPTPTRHASMDTNKQSWEQVDQDNASTPNVTGQSGRQGGIVQFELQGGANTFSLGGGGTPQGPPTNIPQYWGEGDNSVATTQKGLAAGGSYLAPPQQAMLMTTGGTYSGMTMAIHKWGIGDAKTQAQELRWQQGMGGDKNKIEQFCEVAGALQAFKTYLFMKPGSAFCTVVHLSMKFLFLAITEATQQLQGHLIVIGFVGDQTLIKQPTPILLPPWKTWEWIWVNVATDGPAIIEYYENDPTQRGTDTYGRLYDGGHKGPTLCAHPAGAIGADK
jgi:hypothetical protein